MSETVMEEKIVLPTKMVEASRINAKRMVIYSKPKTGKTSCLAGLEGNLILDLENGSDFVNAFKLKANNLDELKKIGEEIKKAKCPYKFISIDTVTSLEEMVKSLALSLYKQTSMGASYKGDDVLKLPNGAGYLYVRQAFFQVLDYIDTLAPNIILVGHIKDKQVDDKGEMVMAANIDLQGKLKSLICSQADAIGYMFRRSNDVILSFVASDEVTTGARPIHLRNQEFVISTMQEDGKLKTNWDKIYI